MRGWLVLVVTIAHLPPARAQEPVRVGSEVDHYLRILELDGAIRPRPTWRPAAAPPVADSTHPWSHRLAAPARPSPRDIRVGLLPVEGTGGFSSTFPVSRNDGALWSGRGFSGIISAGALFQGGPVTVRLQPELLGVQNRAYVHPLSPFAGRFVLAYPWNDNIDWPSRQGFDPYWRVGWGESEVRLAVGPVTAALSHESLWWGPGERNAIMMSNTAGGFPHVDVGTARPVPTAIGEFELRGLWGALDESPFFDSIPGNDTRFLAGLVFGYRPSFLPGLSLGFMRVLYQEWPAGGLAARHLTGPFSRLFDPGPADGSSNDLTDQLAALTGRWVLPSSQFELYFEWARDDFSGNLRDFLVEPNHAGVYTLGVQKLLGRRTARWRVVGEVTALGRSASYQARSASGGTVYTHARVSQGYTHRGQLLGAAIGPAANSQFVGVDRYAAWGRWGLFLERVRYNDDFFYDRFRILGISYEGRPVDLTVGGSVLRFTRGLDLSGRVELTYRLNRDYRRADDVVNLQVGLSGTWPRPRLPR